MQENTLLSLTALSVSLGLLLTSSLHAEENNAFWEELKKHCKKAYAGKVQENEPPDVKWDTAKLVMHFRQCNDEQIRIPLHVGENRSRTWVLTKTEKGLLLKHDHRHKDGSPDKITNYGGNASVENAKLRINFPADSFTAELLPVAKTNVWTLEIQPGKSFFYELRRKGTKRKFIAKFDLSKSVSAPPPPWGTKP